MRAFLITDRLNQLHWTMLKSVLIILAILPMSHFFLQLMQQVEGSSQIMVGFLGLSILSANCIFAFVSALKITTWHDDLSENTFERRLFKIYRHVPISFLTFILLFVVQ